ncbi:hypothetical protein TNCV_4038901 [Trichonephila clavipes]|nr:hypothetical protein TNCV_4038901 [Trichonephila clavipes]
MIPQRRCKSLPSPSLSYLFRKSDFLGSSAGEMQSFRRTFLSRSARNNRGKRDPLRTDFTEIDSYGGCGEYNWGFYKFPFKSSRFRTARPIVMTFGLHVSFVELKSAKNVFHGN